MSKGEPEGFPLVGFAKTNARHTAGGEVECSLTPINAGECTLAADTGIVILEIALAGHFGLCGHGQRPSTVKVASGASQKPLLALIEVPLHRQGDRGSASRHQQAQNKCAGGAKRRKTNIHDSLQNKITRGVHSSGDRDVCNRPVNGATYFRSRSIAFRRHPDRNWSRGGVTFYGLTRSKPYWIKGVTKPRPAQRTNRLYRIR